MIILRISIKVSLLKKNPTYMRFEFCKTFNLYIDRLPALEVRYQRYICNMEYFYQIRNCLCTHIFSYISIDSITFCKESMYQTLYRYSVILWYLYVRTKCLKYCSYAFNLKKKIPNLAFVEGGYNLRLCCIWFYTFDPTNQYFLFSVF